FMRKQGYDVLAVSKDYDVVRQLGAAAKARVIAEVIGNDLLPPLTDPFYDTPVDKHKLARGMIFSIMEKYQNIGVFLKEYAKSMDISNETLAEKLDVPVQTIGRYHSPAGTLLHPDIKLLADSIMDRIIATNAYQFPTGRDGHVH